ncbi:MAG: hypothetical protein J5732_02915 [Bacteroidaceae bacterium]|nr:hypothetical protein [Bacteroidaceae bacterium]
MIHYGKEPSGNLIISINPDEVGEVYDLLQSAGLLQCRTLGELGCYILKEYADDIEKYRRRIKTDI